MTLETRPAPYPADTRAKGWRFELDYERIEQSATWGLTTLKPDARPWLLMTWYTAWKQTPCGSMPADPEVFAGLIGASDSTFGKHRKLLLRGWWLADDGRLYHDTLVQLVQQMLDTRGTDRARQDARQKQLVAVRKRDGRACVYCGHTKYLTLDHLLPLSRGGDNDERNLAMACRPCNSKKGTRTPDEAGMKLASAITAERWRSYMEDRAAQKASLGPSATPNFSAGEKQRNSTGTGTRTEDKTEDFNGPQGAGAGAGDAPGPTLADPDDSPWGDDDPPPPSTPPEGAEDGPGLPQPDGTVYGSISRVLRQQGIDANPANIKFRTLIDAGADALEFLAYADRAKAEATGAVFAYLVGIVANERIRAKDMAGKLHQGRMPAAASPAASKADALMASNIAAAQRFLAKDQHGA